MRRSCSAVRESISARLDGEAFPIDSSLLDRHVTSCRSCREFEEAARRLKSESAVQLLGPAGSGTEAVIALIRHLPDGDPGVPKGRDRRRPRNAPRSTVRRGRRVLGTSRIRRAVTAGVPMLVVAPLFALGAAWRPPIRPQHPPSPCTSLLASTTRRTGATGVVGAAQGPWYPFTETEKGLR